MREAARKQVDRFQRFMSLSYQRIITVRNDLNLESVGRIEGQICKFVSESDEPIVLEFNTNGGKYIPSVRLCHFIRSIEVPIYGVVRGDCFSSGWPILQACDERWAIEESRFLIHSNYINLKIDGDSDPQALYQVALMEVTKRRMWREDFIGLLISLRPQFSREQLLAEMRKDRVTTAREALELEYIDQIVPM